MFIYCFDKDLEDKLIKMGYKQAKFPTRSNFSIFIHNDNINFDFSKVDSNKYKICNKMTF